VNKNNDFLLGFSHYSANIFAEADYALAPSGGSTNTVDSPATLKAGQGLYFKDFGGGRNRWGDYSATLVDPVNDLDFWTLQEFAAFGNAQGGTCSATSCWGAWWGKITAPNAPVKKRKGQVTTF
jgi:hypothetical protein